MAGVPLSTVASVSDVSTISEALLTVLKWSLLALLYLFFLRVLQATWQTVGPQREGGSRKKRKSKVAPPSAPTAGTATDSVRSLRILQPPELVGKAFEVKGQATLGRAAACEITLDDTFVSQMHARVSLGESGVVLEDLGSTNGTYLNRQKVISAEVVHPGDQIQLGGTVLELR